MMVLNKEIYKSDHGHSCCSTLVIMCLWSPLLASHDQLQNALQSGDGYLQSSLLASPASYCLWKASPILWGWLKKDHAKIQAGFSTMKDLSPRMEGLVSQLWGWKSCFNFSTEDFQPQSTETRRSGLLKEDKNEVRLENEAVSVRKMSAPVNSWRKTVTFCMLAGQVGCKFFQVSVGLHCHMGNVVFWTTAAFPALVGEVSMGSYGFVLYCSTTPASSMACTTPTPSPRHPMITRDSA